MKFSTSVNIHNCCNTPQAITEYALNTYFRHFNMYKYAFTPKVSCQEVLLLAICEDTKSTIGLSDIPVVQARSTGNDQQAKGRAEQ